MHPNTFLRTFWRSNYNPVIFVAMSFDDASNRRFAEVIQPAVATIKYARLTAHRVDLSKTGDSILTDINDGIAHSLMILADVSVVGHDSKTGKPYRNANVMYEVGLALACRQSSEVLLIRDDREPFLFDVSTVPHKHIDFADSAAATVALGEELESRLKEIQKVRDARIAMMAATLTTQERQLLTKFAKYSLRDIFWLTKPNMVALFALTRLLDKQVVRTMGRATSTDGQSTLQFTELGWNLARNLDTLIPTFPFAEKVPEAGGDLDLPDENPGTDAG